MPTTSSGTPTTFNPATPPAPKPLYPDTPWWATLVAVLVTAFASIVGTVVFMKGGLGDGKFEMPTGASLLVDTVTYIPHVILLFGVLADMFTFQGVWSIGSIVGILSIFANYVFKYFWIGLQSLFESAKRTTGADGAAGSSAAGQSGTARKGGGPNTQGWFKNYDGCNVQGLEGFGSTWAPQTLVVTATVFCYYIFDLVRNRGWLNSLAALLVAPMVFIAEALIIGDCNGEGSGFAGAIRAAAEGILFGGVSYAIVQTYYPDRLLSSIISPFPKRSKSDLTVGPDGKLYDADGYPWVVLPNGQTYPDLSSAQSRSAFSAVASMRLGTGQAPSCSA